MTKAITRRSGERSMSWGQAYLRGAVYVVAFVGSIWAWRFASLLFDRVFSGRE